MITSNLKRCHKIVTQDLLNAQSAIRPAIGNPNAAWVRKARFFVRKILPAACQIGEAKASKSRWRFFIKNQRYNLADFKGHNLPYSQGG
jgi:hypothetical protein